ncbi:MAG: 7-cyano-7-deazaguanine synthase QueC [Planctomycetaceae bacterium]|nr:7-cyano-7-deazaguanine synthase QueC [Planctomycetaceae bacterium]
MTDRLKQTETASSKKAVILLSGGLDSSTTLAIARSLGYELYALSFDYGQKHRFELESARKLAKEFHVAQHVVMSLDLSVFGGSALTSDLPVPKGRTEQQMGQSIPVTYVPARNTVFLSVAMGWAESLGASEIFLGVNAVDYSGYPDCRPEFIRSFEALAQLATKTGVEKTQQWEIHAPLIQLTKAEIIHKGLELGVDYAMTHTCYDPDSQGDACGTCDACLLRLQGFKQAGKKDPATYQASCKAE